MSKGRGGGGGGFIRTAGGRAKVVTADGIRYVKSPGARNFGRQTTIMADPRKLDQQWRQNRASYLPTTGQGFSEVPGRRERFRDFLNTGTPVNMPEVTFNAQGQVTFTDGRHRTAVLRDQGRSTIPVTVPSHEAARARRLFGK